MAKEDKKYSKYYYDYDRNTYNYKPFRSSTMDEDLKIFDDRVPEYYKGKNGYEARKVCDNFDLPYHLATSVTYLLRAYSKHESPVEDITKAIAHLEFELDKIKRNK